MSVKNVHACFTRKKISLFVGADDKFDTVAFALIYHERAVIYETKRVETIIFHHLYERRFPFLRKGKISVSTHNILKQSLRHLSDQSAFITFGGGGGGWVVGGWRGFGGIAGGNGREISSCQQIVNSPTEKKNRTKQKKLKRVKGKK